MKVWRRNKCFGKLKVLTGLSQNTGKYSIQLLKHHHHYHNVDDHTCDVAPDRALQKTSLVPPILSTCGVFLPIMMKMVLANLMKMVLMAMFLESNLLPALLWVPAVSPRAVMLTTGLDTFIKNKGF